MGKLLLGVSAVVGSSLTGALVASSRGRVEERRALATREVQGQESRRALVIGAGVAGVCTAYQLARRGFQVTS